MTACALRNRASVSRAIGTRVPGSYWYAHSQNSCLTSSYMYREGPLLVLFPPQQACKCKRCNPHAGALKHQVRADLSLNVEWDW